MPQNLLSPERARALLQGILCGAAKKLGSPLAALNQGPDATIQKAIASLDFPAGEVLTWVLQASLSMDFDGFDPLRLQAKPIDVPNSPRVDES